MTSVKQSLFRHPAVVGAGAAALAALIVANLVAFMRGNEAAWLLGFVILADMAAIAAGIFIAVREVVVAEKRTEASQAQLGAIVDSAMDAIITVDDDQNVVLFNEAAERMFGCKRQEAIGRPLERFIPAIDRD